MTCPLANHFEQESTRAGEVPQVLSSLVGRQDFKPYTDGVSVPPDHRPIAFSTIVRVTPIGTIRHEQAKAEDAK